MIEPAFAAAYPREAVVAIWPDGTWAEFANIHDAPERSFRLSEHDTALLNEHPPALFLHSHPNGPAWPSDADTDAQIATGWTWGIVVVHGDAAGRVLSVDRPEIWGPDAPVLPLEGRSYLWGVRDCWTLVRDYYRAAGHSFPDIPRVKEPGPHHTDPARVNQFTHWAPRIGFERVTDRAYREPGDLVLMAWGQPRINHCAVYLGESRYLHQPDRQPSSIWQAPTEERMLERMAAQFWRLP